MLRTLVGLVLCAVLGLWSVPPVAAEGLADLTETASPGRLGCGIITPDEQAMAVALSMQPASRYTALEGVNPERERVARLCAEALQSRSCTSEVVAAAFALVKKAPSSARFTSTMDKFTAICAVSTLIGMALDTSAPRRICMAAGIGLALYKANDCVNRNAAIAELADKVTWPPVITTGYEVFDAVSGAVQSGAIDRDEANMLIAEFTTRLGLLQTEP